MRKIAWAFFATFTLVGCASTQAPPTPSVQTMSQVQPARQSQPVSPYGLPSKETDEIFGPPPRCDREAAAHFANVANETAEAIALAAFEKCRPVWLESITKWQKYQNTEGRWSVQEYIDAARPDEIARLRALIIEYRANQKARFTQPNATPGNQPVRDRAIAYDQEAVRSAALDRELACLKNAAQIIVSKQQGYANFNQIERMTKSTMDMCRHEIVAAMATFGIKSGVSSDQEMAKHMETTKNAANVYVVGDVARKQ